VLSNFPASLFRITLLNCDDDEDDDDGDAVSDAAAVNDAADSVAVSLDNDELFLTSQYSDGDCEAKRDLGIVASLRPSWMLSLTTTVATKPGAKAEVEVEGGTEEDSRGAGEMGLIGDSSKLSGSTFGMRFFFFAAREAFRGDGRFVGGD
jgi:hypothetical protein